MKKMLCECLGTNGCRISQSGGETDARARIITAFVSSAVLAWTAVKTCSLDHAVMAGLAEGPAEHQAPRERQIERVEKGREGGKESVTFVECHNKTLSK